MEELIRNLIIKYTLPVFAIGFILMLACLLGNTVGFIESIIYLDVDKFMWHLERFTYYVPMLGLFMAVMYVENN